MLRVKRSTFSKVALVALCWSIGGISKSTAQEYGQFPGQFRNPFSGQHPAQFPGQPPAQFPAQFPGQRPAQFPAQFPGQFATPKEVPYVGPVGPKPKRESTKLPKVPSVASMIGPQAEPLAILQRSNPDTTFESAAELIDYRIRVTPRPIGGDEFWLGGLYTWTAPNFYSQPLYFQQTKMELYNSQITLCLRPAVSYSQFLGTIPLLPYKFVVQPIHSRAYTLGQGRPID